MPFWKSPYQSMDKWTSWDHALSQHKELLEVSGFPCKVLSKKTKGEEVGTDTSQIIISSWDTVLPAPKKTIWIDGDGDNLYPDSRSIKLYVDGEELTQVFNHDNITLDTEFYIDVKKDIIGITDNVAIFLNDGFDISGKVISYFYTTIAKNINVLEHSQPSSYTNTYRTEFYEGFVQYINPASKFRGKSYPNTILISFPSTMFDTVYVGQGKFETHVNTCWTMGDRIGYPTLKEFDIVYRMDLGTWYEIKSYTPNYIYSNNQAILATQSFEVNQLSPDDSILNFSLQ